jgi:Mn2+/Fe2+ NRAMP family transporter
MATIQAGGPVAQTTPVRNTFWSTFGPGLLWAGTAIGVSHLVQSTRAGELGGFSLAWIIVAALILKYPFFEYGPRYAAATGESLVEGYHRIGKWAAWLYLAITAGTSVASQAAIGLFTAFLLASAFGLQWSMGVMGAIVIASCAAILAIGRFKALDRTIKVVLLLLTLCTMTAALTTLGRLDEAVWTPYPLAIDDTAVTFAFILALVGWMPSAVDLSVWSSLWTLAKNRASNVKASVPEALLDFRIGYIGTSVIAFAFLTLGATVMYASGESFSPDGAVFSLQLVDLYTATLGDWMRPIIMVAVITTMYSTILTVVDGYPRSIERTIRVLRHGPENLPDEQEGKIYWAAVGVIGVVTVGIFTFFTGNMTTLVDIATIVAFLTGPVLGYINLKAITSDKVPVEYRPGFGMRVFSYLGIVLMTATAAAFAVSRFL